jgi:acetyl-CoA C-acetyltransferase
MESMTNAPYLLPKARGGYRIGHDRIFDHMMLDGLEDAYEPGRSMGTFGEDCAAKYSFTRAEQDAFATASVQRAKAATETGAFAAEITPVTVKGRAGDTVISIDEGPGKVKLDKIPTLKPAFKKDGTITAASSSSHQRRRRRPGDDDRRHRRQAGLQAAGAHRQPCRARAGARVVCHRPVGATQKALAKAGWSVADVDLWEVNEAFAVVPMALMKELNLLARDRQRQRRRLRAGPPDRGEWCAHHGHADPRAEGPRPQERPGDAVHRWRRSHRRGAGAALILIANCGHSTLGWSCFYSNIHP